MQSPRATQRNATQRISSSHHSSRDSLTRCSIRMLLTSCVHLGGRQGRQLEEGVGGVGSSRSRRGRRAKPRRPDRRLFFALRCVALRAPRGQNFMHARIQGVEKPSSSTDHLSAREIATATINARCALHVFFDGVLTPPPPPICDRGHARAAGPRIRHPATTTRQPQQFRSPRARPLLLWLVTCSPRRRLAGRRRAGRERGRQ